MLRIGFLPSDFNPMVLMLGEAEDFRALGGVLRGFARDNADVRLDTLGFCHAAGTRLLLTASAGPPGVRPEKDGGFLWRIDGSLACRFAAQADELTDPGPYAGSAMLECSIVEEIPVKLSRGEYTEDFLLPAA
jgi:hypothetical protein